MNKNNYNNTAVNTVSVLLFWSAILFCNVIFGILLAVLSVGADAAALLAAAFFALTIFPYYYLLVLIYRCNVTLFASKPLIRLYRAALAFGMLLFQNAVNIAVNLAIIAFSLDAAIIKTVAISAEGLIIYAILARGSGLFKEKRYLIIALAIIIPLTAAAALVGLFSLHVVLLKYNAEHILYPCCFSIPTFVLAVAVDMTLAYLHTEAVKKFNERSDLK